jgi:hypothetical protein
VSDTSRYHGFFLADTYAAARLVDGLDVNLNLLRLNPFGTRLLPWPTLPHRLSADFTNKQVSSLTRATDPAYERFVEGKYLLLELEAFL